MKRKKVQPGEQLAVPLSQSDLDLLIEKAFLPDELIGAFTRTDKVGRLRGMMNFDDLEELIEGTAAAGNHESHQKTERKLDALFKRLSKLQRSFDDGLWNDSNP